MHIISKLLKDWQGKRYTVYMHPSKSAHYKIFKIISGPQVRPDDNLCHTLFKIHLVFGGSVSDNLLYTEGKTALFSECMWF